jgi:hypothetical protein
MSTRLSIILRRLGTPYIITICLIACVGVSAFALARKAWLSSHKASIGLTEPSRQSNEKAEVELVTLQPWGFQPKEITRPEGKFFLVINNRSELIQDLTFSLTEERGAKLKETKLGINERKNSNDLVDLNPGIYFLTVPEHPEWVCKITIAAK